MAPDIKILEQTIGHSFSDKSLLREALTHASAGDARNYERLEFLGDRVLGIVMAEILFEKFPEETEGDLAKRLAALVRGELLAKIARSINLGIFLNLSEGERGAGGAENDHMLADAMESVMGALYREAGLEACRVLVQNLWDGYFNDMKAPPQHPKTGLQEWAQGQGLPLPVYKLAGQEGPDHAPLFKISLKVKDYDEVIAEGRTRQLAETAAAQKFLDRYAGSVT